MQTISLGSVMRDVQAKLSGYSKISGVAIELDDRSAHQPVLAEPGRLTMGLELAAKIICDIPSDEQSPVIMRADTRHGYPRIGVYREDIELNAKDLRLARNLLGKSRVNAGQIDQLGALRLVVASRLLETISLKLRRVQSNKINGLGLQLDPSSQLGLFNV